MCKDDRSKVMQVVEQGVMLLEHGLREIWELLQQINQRLFDVTTVKVKEAWVNLDEEHIAFIADTWDTVDSGPDTQTLPTTAIFQTDDLDAFDTNCDETPSESAVLMAKLYAYELDVLSEYSKQPVFVDDSNIDITENESEVVQDTTSSEQQDAMIMSIIEEMSNQVAKCNAVNQENKTMNESLTAELERFQEMVKNFEARQKFDLNDREEYIDSQIRDKQYFEIQKKELLIENDQKLEQIISQDIICTAMHSYEDLDASEFKEFFEIKELKAQLQKKSTTISNLKDHIAKLKGKSVSDCTVPVNNSNVISLGMYKLDLQPLSPKLKKNREARVDYLKQTKEHADTLRDIVEQARALKPLDNALDYACKFTTCIHKLLVYVSATCSSSRNNSEKLVAVTPMNKSRQVRFAEPNTSTSNIQKHVDSHNTQTTNKPLLTSTRVNSSTNASGSKPKGNTRNNRISRTSSSN
ncbi:hypothetical protein Tco_0710048 [Tanacetum coccineum]